MRTQSIVSATPGGLARSSSRSRWAAATTLPMSCPAAAGSRIATISASRAAVGYPIQW